MSSEIFNKVLLSNINFQDKIKACEDIKFMEIMKEYAITVCFDFNETTLFCAFAFNKSILGFDFWMKISDQIDN